MLKKLISGLLLTSGVAALLRPQPRFVGSRRTCDGYTAFPYRMGASFPGVVNRSHPASIEGAQQDLAAPVLGYGLAVVASTATPNTIRQMNALDTALTAIYGISVRPYPIQQTDGGMNSSFGNGTPPTNQPLDVATSAYIMMPVFGTPKKGDPVYIWVAATSGGGVAGTDHIQGGAEAANTPGSTILLANTLGNIAFNGPPDANGFGEVRFRI